MFVISGALDPVLAAQLPTKPDLVVVDPPTCNESQSCELEEQGNVPDKLVESGHVEGGHVEGGQVERGKVRSGDVGTGGGCSCNAASPLSSGMLLTVNTLIVIM